MDTLNALHLRTRWLLRLSENERLRSKIFPIRASLLESNSKGFDPYGWKVLDGLKAQKHLAQGNALGNIGIKQCRPERAKASHY